MPRDVFISYSSANSAEAQALCDALEAADITCWIAPRNIQGGTSWSDAIMEALNDCRVVALLLSSTSNVSLQVHNEVNAATNLKKAILPIRLEDIPLTRHMAYYLGRLHWLSALDPPLTQYLPALVQAVHGLLNSEETVFTSEERGFTPPAPAAHSNLYRQVSHFIGREKECKELGEALASFPLVTLLGTGGIGKTRLAIQVAEEVLGRYAEGVCLIELAALTEPGLLPQIVANGLELPEQSLQPPLQTLLEYLKSRHLLLVLDNCEHLIAPCATLADTLLKACPYLTILATSREALNVSGEHRFPVPSLSLPDLYSRDAKNLNQSEAACLFVERAQQVNPDFAVTDQNAFAVAQLCHRLDGVALALELAAARVRSLTVEEICARLDHRFRLLTGGSRTALPRQQTLRALMDWSYDLLKDQEKALLCRLSVFAGGWTLEAAEAICTGPDVEDWEVLDLLTSLADKSLVIAEQRQSQTRYRLLQTVRQYAEERFEERGGADSVCARHQVYFVALAEEAEMRLYGPEQAAWLDRLEREHDNLRAALERGHSESALRLAGALWRFWDVRGYVNEGWERLTRLLAGDATATAPAIRAKALRGAAGLSYSLGNYAAAQSLYRECLALRQETNDRSGMASALNGLGNIAQEQGDYAAAHSLYEESLILYRALEDKGGIAALLILQGTLAYYQGDYATARTLQEQSLALMRELGDKRGIASALMNLGDSVSGQGELSLAQALYEESLALRRELGERRGVAWLLNSLGDIAQEQGDLVAARTLNEEGLAIHRELGHKIGIAYALYGLGNIAREQEDYAAARTFYEESLMLYHALEDKHSITNLLEAFAALAVVLDPSGCAPCLWGAAEVLRAEVGVPLSSSERRHYDVRVAQARTFWSEEDFTSAWAKGRTMTMEQAIQYALEQAGI